MIGLEAGGLAVDLVIVAAAWLMGRRPEPHPVDPRSPRPRPAGRPSPPPSTPPPTTPPAGPPSRVVGRHRSPARRRMWPAHYRAGHQASTSPTEGRNPR